jgi:hypothetical protein
MSNESPKDLTASERDGLVSMIADQEIQFERFRENVNGRLANLERARARKSSSFFDFDFEKMIGLALVFLFAMILTRVLVAALAAYAAKTKGETHGGFQVSEA